MLHTKENQSILIVHPAFAGESAIAVVANSLLGTKGYPPPASGFEKLIPGTLLPHFSPQGKGVTCTVRRAAGETLTYKRYVEQYPVSGVVLDKYAWTVNAMLDQFSHTVHVLRSPFSLLAYRALCYLQADYAKEKGHPREIAVTEKLLRNLYPGVLTNWCKDAAIAALRHQALSAEVFFAESIYSNPSGTVARLAKIFRIDNPKSIAEAESTLTNHLQKYPFQWETISATGLSSVVADDLIREMQEAIAPCHPLFSEGYLDIDDIPDNPSFRNITHEELFQSLNLVEHKKLITLMSNKIFHGLRHLPGKSVVHIPARAGSSRFIGKNLAEVGGDSLLGRTIAQARAIPDIDRVILNTDSKEYIEVGKRNNAEAPFLRPPELATDTASLQDVQSLLLWWLACEGYPLERLVEMYSTSPFRDPDKMRRMHEALKTQRLVYSATTFGFEDNRVFVRNGETLSETTQRPSNGGMKRTGHFAGVNSRRIESKQPDLVFLHNSLEERVDIDTFEDFQLFQKLLKLKKEDGATEGPDLSNSQKELNVLYISEGNLPSRAANAMQAAKMAQAFHRTVSNCCVLTAGDWYSKLEGNTFNFMEWHGLTEDVHFECLPMEWKAPTPYPPCMRYTEYPQTALTFAQSYEHDIIFTRSIEIAMGAANHELPVILETHESDFADLCSEQVFKNDNFIGVVTISQILKTLFVERGLPPEKCYASPLGVDLQLFKAAPSCKNAKRELGLDDRPLIVYAGHFIEEKDAPILFKAAKLLPNYHFMLVGGWPDNFDHIEDEFSKYEVDNVTLTGFVYNSKIPLYLAAADICALTFNAKSQRAAWVSPLKLFEYMAAKRPIVAADIPSLRRYVEPEVNALCYRPGDEKDLAAQIQRLVENKDLAERLGENSFSCAPNYTWDRRVKGILDYYTPMIPESA